MASIYLINKLSKVTFYSVAKTEQAVLKISLQRDQISTTLATHSLACRSHNIKKTSKDYTPTTIQLTT